MTAGAVVVLEDGEIFYGTAFSGTGEAFGEVIFNTSMTGYQEILTDPSYCGQIVTMTYPHIGNYGTAGIDNQSRRPWAAALIVRDGAREFSSWRADGDLDSYLAGAGIVAVSGIDTRRLTRHIRNHGSMRAVASVGEPDPQVLLDRLSASEWPAGSDLVSAVTTQEPYEYAATVQRRFRVAAYDCGIKTSQLAKLAALGCEVVVWPSNTPADVVLESNPDGVFISNGPGDPADVTDVVNAIRTFLDRRIALFGICLGHQLLAIAVGLRTSKLRFGHHGGNHPVLRLRDSTVAITTQNHGYTVELEPFGLQAPPAPGAALDTPKRVGSEFGPVELTHINLNDYTVEGLALADRPAFGVQYHPEAAPGPSDASHLFNDFVELMDEAGSRR